MALHRKQRGMLDASPQYVRIPTSRASGQAVGYSLYETHSPTQRVYAKRYAPGDRSRKMSSLQLRACFVLCVLLYFGAIYFADDIASLGRVVGSEQNSQSFFVHSLRPRGRSHMRVGRAVDAKKMEVTTVPMHTVEAVDDTEEQQQQGASLTKVPEVEATSPEAVVATTEIEEAKATEPLEQPETEVKTMHQNEVLGDAVHPDDQGEGSAADPVRDDKAAINVVDEVVEKEAATTPSGHVESSDVRHKRKRQQEHSNVISPKVQTAVDQQQPTAALRLPEKDGDTDAVPAASPARGKTHVVPSDAEGTLGRRADRDRKSSSKLRKVDEQPPDTTQENRTEHTSDI